MENSLSWEEYFIKLLDVLKLKSKDPSTKVSALITDDFNTIISTGYNGFPICVRDTEERYNNRELKYKLVVHAEMNAILLAARNGKSLSNKILWVTKFPCCECAKAIIQSGIKRVNIISEKEDKEFEERWKESIELAITMFTESNTSVYKYIKEHNYYPEEIVKEFKNIYDPLNVVIG